MPRPGLIVGLGGTGQWVLTWLKRDLLLSNNGVMPENVRLLAIDTCTRLEAGTSRVTAKGQMEEAAEVGGVTLGKDEFIYIGGNAFNFAEQIRDGLYPQAGQWFHAGKWLSTQNPATFVLDDGAGRIRQFGRLAIFKDIQGQETSSLVWRALRNAIDGVHTATSEQRRLEVIVVGSFAGGTGSGLFIDTALVLRMLANSQGVHHVLRGMFALPSVFTTAPDEEMKARSFAAWRELNRFMVVDPDFPMPLVEYVERNPKFRIRPSQRLFDACYLVDGKRAGQPIAQEAKYGVFPMLAEALSALLDEKAGTAYTQWIFANLAPEYARRPETPMYSTVGAYTIQVPAYFVQEVSSYEFGKAALLKLLAPRSQPDEEGQLVTAGAERHLALAAPDRNQEDRGFAGRTRCLDLLRGSATFEGQTAKPMLFHSRIAELVEKAVDGNQRQQIVDQLARGGSASRGSASWLAYFPDLGDDPQWTATRREVMEQMRFNLVQQYRRREGEKEEETRARFKRIPEDIRTRVGGVTSSGEEMETFHGMCGDVLRECERVQLIAFRQVVRLRLLDLLNGHSDDPVVAKSGKLGYTWDYFDGVVTEFDRFLTLMADVQQRREELKPELKLAGLSKRAQGLLNATAGKKIFWFWEHPKVKGAELEYLNAQQRLMEVRRDDILHFYVEETAREMKAICEQVRDALQRWIWHLSTGDSASHVPGMWDGVRDGLQEVKNAHSFDTSTPKVQQIVADEMLPISDDDLKRALSLWQWNATFANERFKLEANILPEAPGESPHELVDPTIGDSGEVRADIGKQNQETFLGLVRRRFMGVAARTTVADEIKRRYPQPESFASEIAEVNAEPLFDGMGAGPRKKSNLIRVQCAENDPYFVGSEGVEGVLRGLNHLDKATRDDTYGIQVVGSENPYKLTMVRTDDLYQYDDYTAWVECLKAYAKHMDKEGDPLDPVLMHNFAAEARAVAYERQLTSGDVIQQEYRPLHPRVVMLLEEPAAMRQFVYLGMLGLVSEKTERKVYRWQLTWTRHSGPQTIWLTKGWNADTDRNRRQPDVLNAIHGYALMKVTQEPGRRDRVDMDFAERLIEQEMDKLGRTGEIKLIENNLEDAGFVGWLRSLGYDPDVPDRVQRQDYADLATVLEMMLRERLQTLQDQEADSASVGGSGPFRTIDSVTIKEPPDADEPSQPTSPFASPPSED